MADVYYVPDGDTLPIMFTTYDGGTGASITLTGLAVTDIEIYKDGGITQRSSDSGYTLIDTDGIDIDTTTGLHGFTIDLSDNTDAGFYSVGSWFHVVVNAVTVDSQTVVFIPAIFRIMAAEASAGVVDANVASIDANAITATSIASNAITSAKIATDAIGAAQIAADAIGSSELAATAASEISTAVWAETTRVLTANTNLNDPTAAAIADAVWDELQADHVTAATFGVLATEIADILTDTNELQTDDVPGLIAALNDPTAAAIADAVWDEVVSGHQTTGSFGAGYDGTNDVIAADVERWLGSAAATPTTAGVPEVDITYIVGSAQAALGIGVYGEGIDTDTNVSSATSTTVVFDSANMSSTDDYYNNMVAWVYGGTGAGQARIISDYAGGTKTATVDPAWGTNPDTTSDVAILPFGAGAAGSLTAAQVADAVWDELQADHTTAATFGVLATEIADILVDTAEIGVAGAGLTDVALATNAVDADAVAAGAIDSGAIAAGAITAASFAANAITSTVLADSAITAAKLATDAITAAKIAADAIGASELAADAVAEIADAVWDETVSTHQTTGSFGAGYDGTNDAIAADVERWLGTAAATPTTAGVPEVDVTFVAGDSAAATGLQGVYSGVDTDTNVAAATASSIQFNDAGMSAVDNFYSGQVVVVYGGTGAGQARLITSYTGATKTAGIEPDWGTNPDTTSDIAIVPYSIGDTAPPTAAAIADAVWTEQIADHSGTGGSTAEALSLLTVASIADGVWDEDIADHVAAGTMGEAAILTAYAGPYGPGIYLDDAAANTATVTGEDGTPQKPVSTFTAARTIADATGIQRYYLMASDLTLAATHENWQFIGLGEVTSNIINLGSQDVDNSIFMNLSVEGTQGGTVRIQAVDCALQDPGAGATTLHILAIRCGIVDRIQVDTSTDNVFEGCYSLVAGTGTPVIEATGASGTVSLRHYSGGIEFEALSASHNVSVETDGQVVFNANCNVNANVAVRGNATITDNTAGMSNLSIDAMLNINAISDQVWDEATSGHVTAGSTGVALTDILADTNELQTDDIPGTIAALNDISTAQVNAEVVDVLKTDTIAERGVAVPTNTPTFEEAISYLYMALTEKVHVNATTKDFYNAAGTNIWSKALSDDGTDYNEASGA